MKKFVALICILLCLLLCSCSIATTGYSDELTLNSWCAKLDGGAEINLKFKDDSASLTLKSGDETTEICGKYLADEKSFVIFMPEISQNYTFLYVPKGDKLDVTYNNSTITLNKTENRN